MDCEHERNYKRLRKIGKVFFLLIFIGGTIAYQQYRYSIETIEVEVYSKNITWVEACDEYRCFESPRFNIITLEEHFTATEDIYDQIEPKASYMLGIKGWAIHKSKRKVVKVY